MGMEEALAQYRAAMERLQLDRDIFNFQKDTVYPQTTLPTNVGALTGMIPDFYPFEYAGLPTFGALSGSAGMMGRIGGGPGGQVDPRLAAMGYSADDLTLGGQQQRLGEDTQRWREREADRQFGAFRSDSDRTFAEEQRRAFQAQQNLDTQAALEMNVDPSQVIGGQQIPAYLAKHAEWARTYQRDNQGRLPGYGELAKALAPFGQVPEDYNAGQPFPGQVPAAAPGIAFDPQHGWTDLVSGQNLDAQKVAQVAAERWQRAIPMRMNEQGQPIFNLPVGASMAGVSVGPGGQVDIPSLDQGARQQGGPAMRASAGNPLTARIAQGSGGGRVQGGPALAYGGPGGAPGGVGGGPQFGAGGVDYGGSGATGAIGQGRATSLDQRRLEEQGRATDIQGQLTQNAQRIDEKQVEYQHAVQTGQLDLANRAQSELTDLNNRKLALETQAQQFGQGIQAGELVGTYNGQATMDKQRLAENARQFEGTLGEGQRQFNVGASGDIGGQDTLDKGALLGQFNGNATLAGQQAYGGSALVDTGLTLDAQRMTGRVGGMSTLEQQQLAGRLANGQGTLAREQFETDASGRLNGQATLAREAQEADIALRAAQTASQMRADPFALEVYRRGVSESGVPNIINAVAGRGQLGSVTGRAPALMTNANAAAPRTGLPSFGGAPAPMPMPMRAMQPQRPFVPPPPPPPPRRRAA